MNKKVTMTEGLLSNNRLSFGFGGKQSKESDESSIDKEFMNLKVGMIREDALDEGDEEY